MTIASTFRRLRSSLIGSAGTVVFGMEDGTVSIFGLIFGVAATTSNTPTVLIAGASGAVAAAVSMMAGAYLDVETTRDQIHARERLAQSDATPSAMLTALPTRLAAAGLTPAQSGALAVAVKDNEEALSGLILALRGGSESPLNPWEQALWMLLADFLAAAVPIFPFVFLPVPPARIVSGIVTVALLIGLGIGRARIAKRDIARTILQTVSIGVAAALAGVGISLLIDHLFVG
jgi:vacuolar iron transporter family protein